MNIKKKNLINVCQSKILKAHNDGLTIYEIASLAGVSYSTIWKLYKGQGSFTYEILIKINDNLKGEK